MSAPAFAGYPLLADLGPCPGGTAYRSAHPLDSRPVVLRKLSDPTTLPRIRLAQQLDHPHLARIVDAGEADSEAFAVLEPLDGAGLTKLIADIGPMPAELAAGFAAQLAAALAAAHAAGLAHGQVTADRIVVGPLEPIPESDRHRPAEGATATLLDLGLVPAGDPADDLRGLGETVYRMLVGREPSAADEPLAGLRPDLPRDLLVTVNQLLAADPSAHPPVATLAERFVPAPVMDVTVPPAPPDRQKLYLWLGVGAVLNLLAVGMIAYVILR